MKTKVLVLASVAAAIVALAGLVCFAADPLLYSPANETPETAYHLNPDVLIAENVNGTTDVYPGMQDILDNAGDITLNIRIRDPASAEAALAEYRKYHGNLKHLIIQLDMNQSEIETFANSTEVQDQLFEQLMNDTATLDALKDLELHYQDSSDPSMVTSVRYQGAALQTRLHELYSRYANEYDTVVPISTKHGLDTAGYNESLEQFQEIVRQADTAFGNVPKVKRERAFNSSTSFITLAIYPREAVYRDTILVLGYLNVMDLNTTITISIDNATLMNLSADDTGAYQGTFTIEKIPAGRHNVTARAADLTSPQVPLLIDPVNSTTTLSARAVAGRQEAVCNGTVIANVPVRYAPYSIVEKGKTVAQGTTDNKGAFNTTVPLSAGTHILYAAFSSRAYPINASESDPVTVTIETPPGIATETSGDVQNPVFVWALVAGILAASGGGAFWYLSRKKGADGRPGRGSPTAIDILPPEAPQAEKTPEQVRIDRAIFSALKHDTLFARYKRLLGLSGLSEAAHQVYLILAGRIAMRRHIDRYQTLTSRELAHTCKEERFGPLLHSFVGAYEKIRYGGKSDERARGAFESSLNTVDRETRGDKH